MANKESDIFTQNSRSCFNVCIYIAVGWMVQTEAWCTQQVVCLGPCTSQQIEYTLLIKDLITTISGFTKKLHFRHKQHWSLILPTPNYVSFCRSLKITFQSHSSSVISPTPSAYWWLLPQSCSAVQTRDHAPHQSAPCRLPTPYLPQHASQSQPTNIMMFHQLSIVASLSKKDSSMIVIRNGYAQW